jgi:alkylation response protein AidB-like acyl-CoA dehydrogenase
VDFEFNETQEMFRQAIRDFAALEIAPLVEDAEKNETFPEHLFPRMGKLGFLCVSYPVEYGAAGMGKTEECIEYEEISQVSASINASLMVQSGLATLVILKHGSEALKQEYLIPAIKGEKIAAFAITEPNAGSDVTSIQTIAKKEGNKYLISGSKTYITNGTICDFVLVAAYTDKSKGHRGISVFVVDKSAPGLTRSKIHKFCYRASDTGELVFDNCALSAENLVGEEGMGFYYLMETLDAGRISHAASRTGAAQAAFQTALDYAKRRIQFGRPIATFQANAFKLARMVLEIEAARWLTYRAAWLYDRGKRCTKEASMAKLLASEVYQRVALEAMQLHGGAAVFEDAVINRHYRDSYLGKITEGTSEIQELIIAREIGIRQVV